MGYTPLDARQSQYRGVLQQLFPYVAGETLDILLNSIDLSLTPPLKVDATDPVSLTLNVGGTFVSNYVSNRNSSIPFVDSSIPSFNGGTVSFPSASGGDITTSTGGSTSLVVPSGNYIKVTLYLDSSGDLQSVTGTPDSSVNSATISPPPLNTIPFAYVVLYNDGGAIEEISQFDIYQLEGSTYTGSFPLTAGGVLYTNGTAVENSGIGTAGQVLTSSGSGAPGWSSSGTGSPIGASMGAFLTLAQFQTQMGDGWVLADGSAVPGSGYEAITGNSSVTASANSTITASDATIIFSTPVFSTTGNVVMSDSQLVGLPSASAVAVGQTIGAAGISPGTTVISIDQYIFQLPGTANGYVFTLSPSGNATAGATYTNNGQTFTVTSTFSSATTANMTGTGVPLASGTLTLASGSGDATLTFTSFAYSGSNATAGATYTNNGQTFTVVDTLIDGTALTCTAIGAPDASGTLTLATGTGDATISFSSVSATISMSNSASSSNSSTEIIFGTLAATTTGSITTSSPAITNINSTVGIADGQIIGVDGISPTATVSAISVTTIPDCRGLFLRGSGTNGAIKSSQEANLSGEDVGGYQQDILAIHTHTSVTGNTFMTSGSGPNNAQSGAGAFQQITQTDSIAPFGSSETRPASVSLNWFIRIN